MKASIRVLCSVIFLAVALRQVNLHEMATLLASGWGWLSPAPWLFCGAVAIGLLSALVNTLKWWTILRAFDVELPWRRVLYHYLVGYFMNTILTGTGEARRILAVGNESGHTAAVATSVLVERWSGVTTQMLVALFALAVACRTSNGLLPLTVICLLACAFLLGSYAALRRSSLRLAPSSTSTAEEGEDPDTSANAPGRQRRFSRLLKRARHGWMEGLSSLERLHRSPATLMTVVALSLLVPLLAIACHACLGLAVDSHPAANHTIDLTFLAMVPIAVVFGQMPISVNGLGIQEVAYLRLFEMSGMSASQALAISMLYHVVKLRVGGLGGLLALLAGVPEAGRISERVDEVGIAAPTA